MSNQPINHYYRQAKFLISAAAPKQFPKGESIEVAFVGRSNAGKSSSINTLCEIKNLARTSKTPGRTQLINFFQLEPGHYLVDLPGYGFAKVADKLRHHWADLMADYFEGRKSLAGMFLIVDIRRQLTDFDRQMLAFGESVGLPVHVLLTKTDKLKRGQAAKALLEVRRDLGDIATVQHFSALNRQGEEEARNKLEEFLSIDRDQ